VCVVPPIADGAWKRRRAQVVIVWLEDICCSARAGGPSSKMFSPHTHVYVLGSLTIAARAFH
jgi:hypothetical protein